MRGIYRNIYDLLKRRRIASWGGDIDSTNLTLTNPQNTTDTNHTKITLLPPQKQKSGGFFGAEFGVGLRYSNLLANIFSGYQWYFIDSNPYFQLGLRLRGHFGYINTIKDYYNISNYSQRINGFQYGLEAHLVMDFLNTAKHTLGGHIAVLSGFGGIYTFHKSYDSYGWYGVEEQNKKWIQTKLYVIPFSTGIHYYYDTNHQIFATFKLQLRVYYYPDTYQSYYTYYSSPFVLTLGYSYKF